MNSRHTLQVLRSLLSKLYYTYVLYNSVTHKYAHICTSTYIYVASTEKKRYDDFRALEKIPIFSGTSQMSNTETT
jgi:hypothetical protein